MPSGYPDARRTKRTESGGFPVSADWEEVGHEEISQRGNEKTSDTVKLLLVVAAAVTALLLGLAAIVRAGRRITRNMACATG